MNGIRSLTKLTKAVPQAEKRVVLDRPQHTYGFYNSRFNMRRLGTESGKTSVAGGGNRKHFGSKVT